MRRFWTLNFTVLLLVALGLTGVSFGEPGGKGGGKPPKDDPPADPPPVLYQAHFYDLPPIAENRLVGDLNNQGSAVGHFYTYPSTGLQLRAYLYEGLPNQAAVDLNDVVTGIPPNTILAGAWRINEWGDITAALSPPDDRTLRRGCIIHMNATDSDGNPQPTVIEVPDGQFNSSYTWARDINDWGDVVGVYRREDGTYGAYIYNPGIYGAELAYDPIDLDISMPLFEVHINNSGEVAGMLTNGNAFRYRIADDFFEELGPTSDSSGTYTWSTVMGINESGVLLGGQTLTYAKKRRGQSSTRIPCRYGDFLEVFPTVRSEGRDINNTGDFVTNLGELYMDETGYLTIDSLIDPADENAGIFTSEYYTGLRINDRVFVSGDDQIGFPFIAGDVTVDGVFHSFILTPVAPPSP